MAKVGWERSCLIVYLCTGLNVNRFIILIYGYNLTRYGSTDKVDVMYLQSYVINKNRNKAREISIFGVN